MPGLWERARSSQIGNFANDFTEEVSTVDYYLQLPIFKVLRIVLGLFEDFYWLLEDFFTANLIKFYTAPTLTSAKNKKKCFHSLITTHYTTNMLIKTSDPHEEESL